MITLDIEKMVDWSQPKEVNTRNGRRMLCKSQPTKGFWDAWRGGKDKLRDAGVSVGKDKETGAWELCWWKPISKEQIDSENKSIEDSKAKDSDIDIPSNEGLTYMPFQKAGIQFAQGKTGTLIADEMGLGKTIQAIGVINMNPEIKDAIIICPASLKINWVRELRKWLVKDYTVGKVEGSKWPDADIVVINFDMLKRHPEKLNKVWDVRIIDEAHFCKNPKAKRAKLTFGVEAKIKLSLTGTPICNRPEEIFGVVNDLDPVTWGNRWRFLKRYCGPVPKLGELQRKLRMSVMVRRLKKDVLTELPDKFRQVIEMPTDGLSSVVNAERDLMERIEALSESKEDRMAPLRAAVELAKVSENPADYTKAVEALRAASIIPFEEISKVRHQTALAKLPKCIEHIKDCLADDIGKKVIVFAHHRDVIDTLREEIGKWTKVAHLYGGMDSKQKMDQADTFMNHPECRVFVGQIQAAGVGLTLTAASHVIFVELDWVPGNMSQCEDRAHRIGQKSSVLVQHLVLEGSLDSNMANKLIAKQKIIDESLDKDHPESKEPITPTKTVRYVRIDKVELDKEISMPNEQRSAIHKGLQMLAGVCDGASREDGMGFNKIDTHIGKALANYPYLSDKQALLGKKLVNKYRRQLSEDLVKQAKGEV